MRSLIVFGVIVCGCASANGVTASSGAPSFLTNGVCPVTMRPTAPLTPPPPSAEGPNAGLVFQAASNQFLYGDETLVVALPNDGTLHPSDPARGLAGGVKLGWDRIAHGQLVVATKRLDAVSVAQPAEVPGGYGDTGFQPSGLNFPSPGCWQVSGTLGSKTLTFVVNVAAL